MRLLIRLACAVVMVLTVVEMATVLLMPCFRYRVAHREEDGVLVFTGTGWTDFYKFAMFVRGRDGVDCVDIRWWYRWNPARVRIVWTESTS